MVHEPHEAWHSCSEVPEQARSHLNVAQPEDAWTGLGELTGGAGALASSAHAACAALMPVRIITLKKIFFNIAATPGSIDP
jgi:hypothetical protein